MTQKNVAKKPASKRLATKKSQPVAGFEPTKMTIAVSAVAVISLVVLGMLASSSSL